MDTTVHHKSDSNTLDWVWQAVHILNACFILTFYKSCDFCFTGTGTNVCYMEELKNIDKTKNIEKMEKEERTPEKENRVLQSLIKQSVYLSDIQSLIHFWLRFLSPTFFSTAEWWDWGWEKRGGCWDIKDVYKHRVGRSWWWWLSGGHHHTLWCQGEPSVTKPWKTKVRNTPSVFVFIFCISGQSIG